jgi:hypothetical protein
VKLGKEEARAGCYLAADEGNAAIALALALQGAAIKLCHDELDTFCPL